MRENTKPTIIGAGAWGSAITRAVNGLVYSHRQERVDEINHLHGKIKATSNLIEAMSNEIIFIAIPSRNIRDFCLRITGISGKILIICAKAIEPESLKLMSEIIDEMLPGNHIAVLSGPNFADEIASGLPAATVIASSFSPKVIAELFVGSNIRTYISDDIIGVQIGGAVKNVLAIACGIAMGRNLGENAKAALITRGLAEMTRLALRMGGKMDTMMGLAGLGDLVLTASSPKSRNMSYGVSIGSNNTPDNSKTVEGVMTAKSVHQLARKLEVEMPICNAVYQILYENAAIDQTIAELMNRPIRGE